MSQELNNLIFNLKFTAKQFSRSSRKCEKEERLEQARCRKSLQLQNTECARIHAQNAIRKHNEGLNFLRLQSRIDAVACRVQSASQMQGVSRSMVQVSRDMEKVLQSADPDRVAQAMDRFERQFEDLDVTSSYMEHVIAKTTDLTTPEDEVTDLMGVCGDQMEMRLREQMGGVEGPTRGRGGAGVFVADPARRARPAGADSDDLEARLAALRGR